MSMTLKSRAELYKLREIVDFLLKGPGATPLHPATHAPLCFFCKKHLNETDFVRHGNTTGPKMVRQITVHHVNHNHDDNSAHSNKALCHTSCHKSYHRSKANAARRSMTEMEK